MREVTLAVLWLVLSVVSLNEVTHFVYPCPGLSYRVCYASSSDVATKLQRLSHGDIEEKRCLDCLVWSPC